MVLKMLWNGTFSVFNRVTNFNYYVPSSKNSAPFNYSAPFTK